ncbi:MAG: hypothetical protein JRH20_29515, partial [Deltaproteobacteria bacterium]|nr:hypothetical protein [Deltaproteobacteria bacterium]
MTDKDTHAHKTPAPAAHEATHQAELERLQALVDHTSDAIFCFEYAEPITPDLPLQEQIRRLYNCVLVNCNDKCARSFGHKSAQEAIGKTFNTLFD